MNTSPGFLQQRDHARPFKDTLKTSLKRLQINPANWKDLARGRPTWRQTVETSAAIHEANCIPTAEAKREARKSQMRPPHNATAQQPPICQRCQRTLQALIGLVRHLHTNCSIRTTPTDIPPSTSTSSPRRQSTLTAVLNTDCNPPPSSQYPLHPILKH
ncbi:hypothetical protein SprV_0200912800 [Sparganum proliferum]